MDTLSNNTNQAVTGYPEVDVRLALFRVSDERLWVLLWQDPEEPGLACHSVTWVGQDLDQLAQSLIPPSFSSRCYMEQLYSYGHLSDNNMSGLTISYFGLLAGGATTFAAGEVAGDWYPVENLPPLAKLDHRIIELAQQRMATKLEYSTLAFRLLDQEFTLGELQQVYQVVQQRDIDKRNFRKRIQALGCVERTGKLRKSGSHRPAQVYRETSPGKLRFF